MNFVSSGERHVFARLGRHQVGALVATAIDFGAMTLLVTGFGASAVLGTVIGASAGAVSNFWLGRHWIFRREGIGGSHRRTGRPGGRSGVDSARAQAWRYGLVSFASLLLNALGEYGLHNVLRLQYQLARALVAITVSLVWNFPMHRWFVFAEREATSPEARRC
jgi:putative flippase GtrA